MYPYINLELTGSNLKRRIKDAGYSIKDIQKYLHLACPQPIYRWYSGKMLPTVDHLYALSRLLNVHMEDLLVSMPNVVIQFQYRDEQSLFRTLCAMMEKVAS